jgi:hypothetical protein
MRPGWLFFAGAWLIILMGYLGIVALVGFYDTLQLAGPVLILAPILGAVGLTLVTVSHLIPIAMGYELVPAYVNADPAGQATLAATADTFAATALVTNAAGNFLNFGVVVPLYAVAILTTRVLPRWIGWLGLLVGWLGLLSPASSVIASIFNIGFIGFFVFMLTMGIALLRRRSKADQATQATTQTPSLTKGRIDPQPLTLRGRWHTKTVVSPLNQPARPDSRPDLFRVLGLTCLSIGSCVRLWRHPRVVLPGHDDPSLVGEHGSLNPVTYP